MMQNARDIVRSSKHLRSLLGGARQGEVSVVARALAIAGACILLSTVLVLEALSSGASAADVLDLSRLVLSALPAVIGLLVVVLSLPRERRLLGKLSALSPTAFGAAFIAWTAALACLDLRAGRPSLVLPVCGAVAGILYWNRPAFLALLLLPAGAVYLSFASVFTATGVEVLFVTVTTWGLAALSALLVRRNTAPSQERLRSLEAENKELWNLSFRDGLTGLYNRRFAQETGSSLFTRALRYHEQLHVLMIDIDHFKKVNDKLGHAVGDIVLRDVAEIIKANVRSSDMAARYGGEEFIIFLVRTDSELVQFVANRIRDGIAAHAFENVPWQVTVSIGVASIQPNDSLDALVDRADKFLYLSKHSGRNRVSGS